MDKFGYWTGGGNTKPVPVRIIRLWAKTAKVAKLGASESDSFYIDTQYLFRVKSADQIFLESFGGRA